MAAGSSLNWYIQLVLVPRIAQPEDAMLLALLDIHNVRSIMYALEHLSWGLFYGLAVIFMALAMEGGKIEYLDPLAADRGWRHEHRIHPRHIERQSILDRSGLLCRRGFVANYNLSSGN